jgi:threonine/homoserine/homoserine lactone efflux protein
MHSRTWWMQGLLNNLLNPKGPLFYLGVLAVFVHSDSTVLYLALLICTTIGISAAFWVLFVYVLQISSVRSRLLAASRWVNGALGIVLIGLGIRLWLAQAPGLSWATQARHYRREPRPSPTMHCGTHRRN